MKSIQHFLLFLGTILFIPLHLSGQISYTSAFYPAAGNPGNFNTTQDFENLGWNTILFPGLSTNQWSGDESIPFGFSFYGQPVSIFKVSANGVLNFSQTGNNPPGANTSIPDPAFPDLSIACFWEEFTTNPPTGSNDFVYTRVFGFPPFRQLWIKWSSFEWGVADFAYVAIVLEETTNKIYLVDMYSSTNSVLTSSTAGLQENNSNGVMAGNNIPLGALGPANSDNQYYEFAPYNVQPLDVEPVSVIYPGEIGCGLNQEAISFSLTNIGQGQAMGVEASFSVNGGPFSSKEPIPGTLQPGDTINYTFNTLANLGGIGTHTLAIALNLNGDGDQTNDTLYFSLKNLLHISSFPYHETFESGNGGWESSGQNSSWELALPANDTINQAYSGAHAWITNASGNYHNNEHSQVESPCFDLTNLASDSWVIFQVWWESEYSWDGAVLQASTDLGKTWENVGSLGTGNNWFNDTTINGIPGGQLSGWTGTSGTANGSDGWVQARHPLHNNLMGMDEVRFRIAFGSDAVYTEDGFAFDDFVIAQAPQVNLGQNGFYCDGDVLDAGNPGQSYQWSTGATTQTITLTNTTGTNIIDSLVIVTITDSFGLVTTDSLMFSMNPPIVFNLGQAQNIDCFGESTGAISTIIFNGMTPFTFSWNHGATSQNITGLPAGSYQVVATDLNGCVDSLGPIILTESPEITLSATFQDITCFGDDNGFIDVTALGGSGSFTYSWSNGSNSSNIDSLSAGNYQLLITDSLGCEKDTSFMIQEPTAISLSQLEIGDVSCIGLEDGFIDLGLMGGTPPYTYSWNNDSTTQNLANLGMGNYYAEIVDSNGCVFQTDTFAVSFTDSIPVAGFTYTISGGTVIFTDTSLGANTYQWDFGDSSGQNTLASPVHTYASNGTYQVMLIIENGCGSDTTVVEVEMMTVGVAHELNSFAIKIYPNPVSDQFFMELHLPEATSGKVRLYHSSGAKVLAKSILIQAGNDKQRVDLPGNLAAGIYLLEVDLGKMGRGYWRVLVE